MHVRLPCAHRIQHVQRGRRQGRERGGGKVLGDAGRVAGSDHHVAGPGQAPLEQYLRTCGSALEALSRIAPRDAIRGGGVGAGAGSGSEGWAVRGGARGGRVPDAGIGDTIWRNGLMKVSAASALC